MKWWGNTLTAPEVQKYTPHPKDITFSKRNYSSVGRSLASAHETNEATNHFLPFPSCTPQPHNAHGHSASWHGSEDDLVKHKPLVSSCMTQHMPMPGGVWLLFPHNTHLVRRAHKRAAHCHSTRCAWALPVWPKCTFVMVGQVLGRGMTQIQGPQGVMIIWLSTKTYSNQKLCQSCPSFLKWFQSELIRMEFCFI